MAASDWVVPLITGVVGIVGVAGTLGGSMISGRYQERAAVQQAQVEFAKLSAADNAAEIKAIRDSSAKYIGASDAFLNTLLFFPKDQILIAKHLSAVQVAGAELVVLADEDLAKCTNSVNAYSASLLNSSDPLSLDQRLTRLATIRADWAKQLRVSLGRLEDRRRANLTLPSSGLPSAAAEVKR